MASETALPQAVQELIEQQARFYFRHDVGCKGGDECDCGLVTRRHYGEVCMRVVATAALELGRAQAPAPDRAVIDRIVAGLFVNGSGQQADRLVLTDMHGRDLGGWCQSAIAGRIADGLLQAPPSTGAATGERTEP